MAYLLGFLIGTLIALTGAGAGTITVPVLILFLGVPSPIAVDIGLIFSAAIKLILVPAQVLMRNVAWRTLGWMLLGGAPGVLIGSVFLKYFVVVGSQPLVNSVLGAILIATACTQLAFPRITLRQKNEIKDRSHLLCWLMLPVGTEVGFSSAGAGALGSAALLSLTPLTPARVIGTDIAFGFVVSLLGGGAHWSSRGSHPELLIRLIAGGAAGAIVGTILSVRIPRRLFRVALWIGLMFLGLQLLLNGRLAHRALLKSEAGAATTGFAPRSAPIVSTPAKAR